MDPKKLAYKEIRERQLADLRAKVCNYHIYKEFSTPFTYVFVKLGISPNAITLSSILFTLVGFYFLSLGTYANLAIGLLFFVLFKIFDMCDGEVVRLQNSHSVEGAYFDRISHYAFSLCLALGLGIGLYRLYQSDIYLILGFIFALTMIMENAMRDSLRLFLRVGMIKVGKKGDFKKDLKGMDKMLREKFSERMYKGHSWENGSLLSKLIGIYPFQGLLYSDSSALPIFMGLGIADYVLTEFLGISMAFFGYAFGLIPIYIFITIVSKLIWIVMFISGLANERHLTETIKEL